MRRLWIVALLLGLVRISAVAAPEWQEEWNHAVEAYRNQDFARAARLWNNLRQEGIESADLFYNLGNAWYQVGQKGRAAWMYENALALAPRHGEARRNLALARAHVPRNEATGFVLFRPLAWIFARVTTAEWAALLSILSLLFAACAAWAILARRRGWLFWGAGLLLALMIPVAMCFAFRYTKEEWRQSGVVLRAGVVVRNAPDARAEAYFEAAEGETLEITESDIAGWYRIKHPGTGRTGYLPEETLGRIGK